MKTVVVIILSVVLVGFFVQIYFISRDRDVLRNNLANLSSRLDLLNKENIDLKSEIEYFSYPENQEKELKSRFNYKKPGEKMMIIVP